MSTASEHTSSVLRMGDEIAQAALALRIDLSQENTFHFYFYVSDGNSARNLAERLKRFSCICEIDPPEVEDEDWLCFATSSGPFTIEDFNRRGIAFSTFAKEYNGVFDGWEFGSPPECNIDQEIFFAGVSAFDRGDHVRAKELFEEILGFKAVGKNQSKDRGRN